MEAIIPAAISVVGGILGAKAGAPDQPPPQQPQAPLLPKPEPVKAMPDPLLIQQNARKKEMERQQRMGGRAGTIKSKDTGNVLEKANTILGS